MSLKEQFYGNLQEWENHCQSPEVQFSSSFQVVRNCEAYRNLVAMGKDILPYVKEVYETRIHEDSTLVYHGLVSLVKEIVGESFEIPEETKRKVLEMRDYTYNWLDDNS